MAISLKEQLKLVKELTYHAPVFDKNYYEDSSLHSDGQTSGTRMFYDFYAIENLWSWVGSGSRPKSERDRQRNNPASTAEEDPLKFQVGTINAPPRFILPQKEVDLIDDVFEQVTRAVAKNLINYTHLAVVQEFQYLMSMAHGWSKFRQALVASYNKSGNMTKVEFDRLIEKYIPEMKKYPDTVKRLLKYSKYYSSMTTKDGSDVYDVTRQVAGSPKAHQEPEVAPGEPEPDPQPEPMPDTGEPDDTDYSAEPTEVPQGADYDDTPQYDIPQKKDDDDGENYFKNKHKGKLNEEKINPSKIKKVYAAMQKAGVTLDDVEKAYNHIEWGGAYGGPRWGAGAIAMLKLMKAKKTENPEDLSHIIDHIYDLQHNTGSLLNKGPMYVSDEDLNRRFRVTHIARFLPFVSPIIRQVITRYLKYIHGDAELEKQKDSIVKSPPKAFTPEQEQQLLSKGLKKNGYSYKAPITFVNKKKEQISGVFYQITAHQNGKFSVYDNFMADVQVYDTFEEAFQYLMHYERDFIQSGGFSQNVPPPVKSEKDQYIQSHTKIKLAADRETALLDVCKMGWRKKPESQYYKAYFPGSKRFHMYAFSDGSYLCTFNDTDAYKKFTDWDSCFNYCKTATDNALPYPDYDEAKALIGKASGTAAQPAVASPPVKSKEYYLEPSEQAQLVALASALGNTTKSEAENGMVNVHTFSSIGNPIVNFSVGKKLHTTFGKPYKIIHQIAGGGIEDWNFKTWNEMYNFIQTYGSQLLGFQPLSVSHQTSTPSASVTPTAYSPFGKELPPNAPSKAIYTAHVGISTPPKNSIRLTKEDEATITAIGFQPKMVGNDVWYIHKSANDTVKFYPNNQGKIIFTGQTKQPVVTMTIDKMLAWLPTKYNAGSKSPLTTPAAPSSSGMGQAGSKAGSMFEKTISDAGFVWNNTDMNYFDGDNVLSINPYPKSTISNLHSGQVVKQFNNLPSLAAYLKNEYPTQKKTLATAKPASKLTPDGPQVDPSNAIDEQEFSQIEDLVAKYPTMLKVEKSHGQSFDGSPTTYASIKTKDLNHAIWSVAKADNKYVLFKVLGQTWDSLLMSETFEQIYDKLDQVLEEAVAKAQPSQTQMTQDQKDWVEAFVVNKNPSLKITQASDGTVHVDDPSKSNIDHHRGVLGNPLFVISKMASTPFTIRYFTQDWGQQYSYETFDTFNEMAQWMQVPENFSKITNLLDNSPKKKIESILSDNNWHDIGQPPDEDEGTIAWENQYDDTIYVYKDGTAKVIPMWNTEQYHAKPFFLESPEFVLEYLKVKHTDVYQKKLFIDVVLKSHNFLQSHPTFHKENDDIEKVFMQQGTNDIVWIMKDGGGIWKDFIQSKDDGYSFHDVVDMAYAISIHKKHSSKQLPPEGITGNDELDQAIEQSGLIFQGSSPGDILSKVYLSKDGAKLKIYDDGSSSFMFAPAPSYSQTPQSVGFNDLETLKDFLQNSQVPNQPQQTTPPTQPPTSEDSILTHKEAKPIMTHNFYQWGAPPHSYDSVDFRYDDDVPMGTQKYGKIQISNGNVLKLEIYKIYTNITDKKELWVIKQQTHTGPKDYTFTTADNLLQWLKGNIKELFSYVEVGSSNKPKKNLHPHHNVSGNLAHTYFLSDALANLATNSGFHQEQNSYGNLWEHNSKFWFQTFVNGIVWHFEKGSKELVMPKENQAKFLVKALAQIKPSMTDEDIDKIFSKEVATRREQAFDRLLRIAKTKNGSNLEGTYFAEEMQDRGFIWNEFDNCYMNEEIFQAVVVTLDPKNPGKNVYQIYWINEDETISQGHTSDDKTVYAAVGPEGAIMKSGKISMQSSLQQPGWKGNLDPSGEKYIKTAGADAHAIKLNMHDNNLLKKLGFVWDATKDGYSQTTGGSSAYFFSDGTGAFTPPNQHHGKTFHKIPEMLKAMVQTYWTSTPVAKAQNTDPNQPSGELYKTHDEEHNAKLVKLNDHDEDLLEKSGFFWWPSENHYYKNKDTGDILKFYDTGGAVWYEQGGDLEEFQTIPHALKFVTLKYFQGPFSNQNYNENPTDENLNPINLNENDAAVLASIGFKWIEDKKMYLKKIGPTETPKLEEAGKKKKKKEDPNQGELPFNKEDPHQSMANHPANAEFWKKKEAETGGGTFDDIDDEQYEVIYAYNSGNATWTRTTDPYSPGSHGDLETKDGPILDILHFVWDRWSTGPFKTTTQVNTPTPEFVGELMKKNGFSFAAAQTDGSAAYHNAEKNKVLYIWPDGKVKYAYQYVMNPETGELKWDISTLTWDNFLKFVNKKFKPIPDKEKKNQKQLLWAPWIQDSGHSEVGVGDKQSTRVCPPDEIKNHVISYGYKWDRETKQFVNNEDSLDTIMFTSNGEIVWYGGMGTEEKVFSTTDELWKFLDWGGISKGQQKSQQTPPTPPSNGKIPMPEWSRFDYKKWGEQGVAEKKYKGNETIQLIDKDAEILKQLGFELEYLPSPVYQYQYINNDTKEKVIFYITGNVEYHASGHKFDYPSVFDILNWLWEKHKNPNTPHVPASSQPKSSKDSRIEASELKKELLEFGFKPVNDDDTQTFKATNGEYFFTIIFSLDDSTVEFMKSQNNQIVDEWTMPVQPARSKLFAMHMSGLLIAPMHSELEKQVKGEPSSERMPWHNANYKELYPKEKGWKPTSAIKLLAPDEMMLSNLGFVYQNTYQAPTQRYVNAKGEMLAFYADDTAKYWPNKKIAKFEKFPSIKAAAQHVWNKAHSTPSSKTKVTGQMPFSDIDYKKWYDEKHPKLPKNTAIQLELNDELLLANQLGFHRNVMKTEKDPAFKVSYNGPDNQIMYFFASGKAAYWKNGEGPKYFDTVKDGIQFLWDKHMPFIEEKITFKKLMASLLE